MNSATFGVEYPLQLNPNMQNALAIQGIPFYQIAVLDRVQSEMGITAYVLTNENEGAAFENGDAPNIIAAFKLAGFYVFESTYAIDYPANAHALAVRFDWATSVRDFYAK